jgi:hypothetical protein
MKGDAVFNVVWQTSGTVVANEWSPYLEGLRDLIADWRSPLSCGNFNAKTGKCAGVTAGVTVIGRLRAGGGRKPAPPAFI